MNYKLDLAQYIGIDRHRQNTVSSGQLIGKGVLAQFVATLKNGWTGSSFARQMHRSIDFGRYAIFGFLRNKLRYFYQILRHTHYDFYSKSRWLAVF